jgi:uncharacterized protein
MQTGQEFTSDIAFTPAVKQIQTRKGSRDSYARMENTGSWKTTITDELAKFITAQTSFFMATANDSGQPYIQHRGGPAGFLHVIDTQTLAFADFSGNRQFISQGNLTTNAKAHLFLIDYAHRTRVKIWGEAEVKEGDGDLITSLMPTAYKARADAAIIFRIMAWDANCPQHIPQRFEAAEVSHALALRDDHIARLEAEIKRLKELSL